MAVGVPTTVADAGGSATSVTTTSFTPAANTLLVAFCVARGASAVIPTISDSQGGTWEAIGTGIDQGFVTARLFARQIGSTPSAMTVTVSSPGATQTAVMIQGLTGAGNSFTNFQSAASLGTSRSVTIDAALTGSMVLGFQVINSGTAQPAPTGLTETRDVSIATNVRIQLAYDDYLSAPTTVTFTSNNADAIAYVLEIKEPGGVLNDYDEPNSPFLVSPYPSAGANVETLFSQFGPEFAGRILSSLIIINDAASTVVPISGVTIGGVAATVTTISGVSNAYVVTAEVPTGTSGDIVVTPTTPGSISKLESFGTFALDGVDPLSAVAAASFSGTSVSFDVVAGGQAYMYARGTGNHVGDLTGLDLDADQWTIDGRTIAWAGRSFVSAVTGHSAGLVDDSGNPILVWVTYEPEAAGPSGSLVKVRVGAEWHTSVVKVYTGGAWHTSDLKVRVGTDWY